MPITDGIYTYDKETVIDDLKALWALPLNEIDAVFAQSDTTQLAGDFRLGNGTIFLSGDPSLRPAMLHVLSTIAEQHPEITLGQEFFMRGVAGLMQQNYDDFENQSPSRLATWEWFKGFVKDHADLVAETTTVVRHSISGGAMNDARFEDDYFDYGDDRIEVMPLLVYIEELQKHLKQPETFERPEFPFDGEEKVVEPVGNGSHIIEDRHERGVGAVDTSAPPAIPQAHLSDDGEIRFF